MGFLKAIIKKPTSNKCISLNSSESASVDDFPHQAYIPPSPFCNNPVLDPIYEYQIDEVQQYIKLRAEYNNRIIRFNQLTNLIWKEYSKAKYQPLSSEMDTVIGYCNEKLSLIDDMKEYYRKWTALQGRKDDYEYNGVDEYKKLAIIYEKRGEYDKAIEVCQTAIKNGCNDDGTKGGMAGRIEKLNRK